MGFDNLSHFLDFKRLGDEIYAPVNVQVESKTPHETPQDGIKTPHETLHDDSEIPHDARNSELTAISKTERAILSFCTESRSRHEIMKQLGLSDRKNLMVHINRLIAQGRLAMTNPDTPRSKNQRYISIR